MNSKNYTNRILSSKLDDYVAGLPAFSLEGAKGVGKTTLAKRYAKTVYKMDNETTAALIAGTPSLLIEAEKPVLLDEWQATPSIWNVTRHFIDDDMSPGQFIFTGSAVPQGAKLHSGAGRIVRVKMRPFSLEERELAPKLLSIASLLQDAKKGQPTIRSEKIEILQQDYVKEILASGFPGIRIIPESLRKDALDGYLDNIIEREFSEQGVIVRKPESLRAWLKAYAAAEGSTTSYDSIMNAATPGQDKKPSKPTTLIYRDTLSALWILDPVLPWVSEGNAFSNLGKAPKHYLVDPALTARLLDIDEPRLLSGEEVRVLGSQTKTAIGRLFEGLVAQSLKVYSDALGLELRHLRTKKGDHEVDFIIEQGETILAFEAKFSPSVADDDTEHLNWLEKSAVDRRVVKIIVYTGQHLVQREKDKVILVPAACLGV